MDQSGSANRPSEVPVQNRPEVHHGSGHVEAAPERAPGGEAHVGGPAHNPVVSAPLNTQLPPISTPVVPPQQSQVTSDAPLVAADDEVIEQEWVQKAKSIVSQTKSDPYVQEQQIGKLQAEYLKKRYGKEIKLTSD